MDYTMGVWAGNNDHTPMIRIDGITGAAPTWYRSMLYAERNLPQRQFPVPSGVQQRAWSSNGVPSVDWFLSGPLPPNGSGGGGTNVKVCLTPDGNSWNYCTNGSAATPGPGGNGQQGKKKQH
jgi:membrane carboxypeptidase/penicillin-binding protein PbpC